MQPEDNSRGLALASTGGTIDFGFRFLAEHVVWSDDHHVFDSRSPASALVRAFWTGHWDASDMIEVPGVFRAELILNNEKHARFWSVQLHFKTATCSFESSFEESGPSPSPKHLMFSGKPQNPSSVSSWKTFGARSRSQNFRSLYLKLEEVKWASNRSAKYVRITNSNMHKVNFIETLL